MASDAKLGEAPQSNAVRDAIHVAIFSAVAGVDLSRCESVTVKNGLAIPTTNDAVGIVDPFRSGCKKGERVWVCLFPGTVIGMTHHWQHPHFDGDKVVSEKWLREYAKKQNSYDDNEDVAFQRLIDGLRERELYFYGSDLHGLYDLDDADELRHHAQIYLGVAIDWSQFSFSCSC